MKTLLLSIALFSAIVLQAQIGVIKSIGTTETVFEIVAEPLSPGFILPSACTDYCAVQLPYIFINDTTVQEATGAAVLKVILSIPSTEVVTAYYSTSNGSALQGQDYKLAKGSLQFNSGETEKTISVSIVSDKKPEPREHFFVELNEATNANLGKATGKIIIDDVPATAKMRTVESVEEMFVVRVMPNPSMHQFTVVIAGKEANAKVELRIIDENGQLLKIIKATASQNFIFGNDLRPGVYLVEVWQQHERRAVTVIKH